MTFNNLKMRIKSLLTYENKIILRNCQAFFDDRAERH